MSNPFVFIVGCPRSGTTLFRRMIDAHPRIAVIPELGWLASRYQRREGLTPEGLVTSAFIEDLVEKGGFGRFTPLPMSRRELLALHGARISYADLVARLFDRYGGARGKPLVGNKTVDHVRNVPILHELWPHAKFLHLIRDGRDVALSAMSWRRAEKLAGDFPSWHEDPVSTAAAWWEWHVRPAVEAGRNLGPQLYYELRYEELVSRPADELERVCDFLGVAYDDSMLRFHEGREKKGDDAKHGWLPPTPGLRDWRSEMPPADVEHFEAIAGGLLDELGYELARPDISRERLEHAGRIREEFETAAPRI